MNQYKSGKGGDRGYWLSFWSGAPVVINRRSRREPIHLDDPFVSVVGALPPDMLSDLSDERGREDGFVHRILFAWPDPMPDRWTERFVQDATNERYLGLFKQLWELKGDLVDELRMSRVVRFTPE